MLRWNVAIKCMLSILAPFFCCCCCFFLLRCYFFCLGMCCRCWYFYLCWAHRSLYSPLPSGIVIKLICVLFNKIGVCVCVCCRFNLICHFRCKLLFECQPNIQFKRSTIIALAKQFAYVNIRFLFFLSLNRMPIAACVCIYRHKNRHFVKKCTAKIKTTAEETQPHEWHTFRRVNRL